MTHRRTDPPGAPSAGTASPGTATGAAPASGVHAHEMQATFRYLRLAIILLTLLLGVGVGMQIASDGGAVLMSVSAYYFTGARDVFVASLCAIGACLIIHRGRSDTEDALLNLSGYLAFVVAFVLEVVLMPQRERRRHTRQGAVVRVAGAVGYLVLAGVFLLARESFFTYGHTIAAVLLFAGILGVVGVNAMAYRGTARSVG